MPEQLQSLFDHYAFLQRCDGYEQGAVDFLLAERRRQGAEGRGEVEAVVQASQFGAAVIVDDAWGRELARRDGLEFHGTLWILQRLHELDLLSMAAVRDCFGSLRRRGIRLPWDLANDFLVQIGGEPL